MDNFLTSYLLTPYRRRLQSSKCRASDTSPYLPSSIATILKENVELQILFMLFITYGIFYVYYRRKLSA